MEKPQITLKLIEEVLDEVFTKAKPKTRDFTMWAGCKTQGMIKISSKDLSLPLCDDPTCPTCSMMHKALIEETSNLMKLDNGSGSKMG
jgi:hypothetical protein